MVDDRESCNFAVTHRKKASPQLIAEQQGCNGELRAVSSRHLMPVSARGKAKHCAPAEGINRLSGQACG